MKIILSFLCAFLFLQPVYAYIASETDCSVEEEANCRQQPGCQWIDWCQQCDSGYECNGGNATQCQNGFDTGWSDLHKQHPAGASSCADWECISGYHLVNIAGVEICQRCNPADLYEHAEFVNSDAEGCAQQCIQGYYGSTPDNCQECPTGSTTNGAGAESISQCTCQSKSNGNNAISLLLIQITGNQYYCGQCGDGIITTANTNPVQCTCYHGANIVNGEQFVAQNTPIQCKCPSNTDTVDTTTNTCQCGPDYYLNENNGTWTCAQCPTHSHHNITGSEDVNDCVCNEDNPTRIYDDNNKLIECGQCPDSNSTYDSATNKCKCIKGYYDTTPEANTVSCAPCPAGSTTLDTENTPNGIGAESKSACTMNSSTQFCDSRGQNCMNLIPPVVEISAQ